MIFIIVVINRINRMVGNVVRKGGPRLHEVDLKWRGSQEEAEEGEKNVQKLFNGTWWTYAHR